MPGFTSFKPCTPADGPGCACLQLLRRVYALRTKTRLEHLRSGLPPLPQTEQASISRRLLLDTRTDAERLEQRKAVARNIYARRREERAALGQAHQAVERLAIPR